MGEDFIVSRRDDDGNWKGLIEHFFYDMLRRCVPSLYEDADTSKNPEFLDKELRAAEGGMAKRGPREADLLVSVPLRSGDERWILLHVEVQGDGGGDLPERMFHYRSLIYARYRKEIAALAIITDKRSPNEPEYYRFEVYGTEVVYRFNRLVVKNLDPEGLKESANPFDLALYAAQQALGSKKDEQRKFIYLRELVTLLSKRGWNHEKKLRLLLFMEAAINLTDEKLIEDIVDYEEEIEREGSVMRLLYAEQLAMKRGWEKGIEKGREEGIEKGIAKGIEKGMEKGMEKARVQIARNFLKMGVDASQVAQATGLPESEVKSMYNTVD